MRHKEGQEPYLSLKNIDRFFGITKALQKVSLDIYEGEVIGLVGSNGAGKSTLMKILTGVLPRTDGEILFRGQVQESYNTSVARQIGINCAYQDLSLCTNLSIFENFAMLNAGHGLAPEPGWRTRAMKDARELLERYFPGSGIDVTRPISALSLTDRQIVEICKTLMSDNLKLLILDEPTSALSSDKAEQLHSIVRELSGKGIAIIYISHKLDEIKVVSDRIVLLSNGQNNGEFLSDRVTQEELIAAMGGVSEKRERAARDLSEGEDMLRITALRTSSLDIDGIVLKKGEIVGVSGLAGSGQQELLQAVFAARKRPRPEIALNGDVAYVSGDRAREGVFHFWHIRDNILIANLDRVKGKLLINNKRADESARYWYDKLKFRAEGIRSNIMSLSGGNQQKALIARGIASEADIIILNDPTAGVDIGTKQDIYRLLEEIRDMGKSVLLYSTEDREMEICDRVYVMREGSVTKELADEDITVPNIVAASFMDAGRKKTEERRQIGIGRLMGEPWMLPLITLVLIFLANVLINPRLMSYSGLRMKVSSSLPLVFAALGQMFIVMCGDVDMGNGYSIGLVNCIVAVGLTGNLFLGLGGLLFFIIAYMAMAALIQIRRIPAIVVTMGAQFVWYGLALMVCPTPGGSCPKWISAFLKLRTPWVPFPIVLAAVSGLVCWYALYRCRYGVVLRGIGNNVQAVERSGWSYLLAKIVAYALAGLFVVLAGMAYTSTCNGADANSSVNYNMMSIATVILGGCEMMGGVPVPFGVVMAALVMNLINSLLTAMKLNSNYQTAIIGIILISVLALKFLVRRKERAGR
ncbi:MAG: ATP-binding cassette domain-containing protein [Synergistaceae bacterium]|nr:ATP-binding cassette domain-containing protein [Synergistaceae bacterium]